MKSNETHKVLPQFLLVEELEYAKFYLDPSKKIILIKYLDDVIVDLEKGKTIVEIVYPFVKNGAIHGMTDATAKNINITSEARKYYSNNKSVNLSVIHAVILKELYLRILMKLFISFDKPTVPTKIFNDFEKAYQFINTYIADTVVEANSSKVPSV